MILGITNKHKIFLATAPIDFRTRLEGTLAICRQRLDIEPSGGQLFIFRNKRLTTLRCIIYDDGGFWFTEKRLSKGKYHFWPSHPYATCVLTSLQLQQLLSNQAALS